MAIPAPTARPPDAARDRTFHPLRIKQVKRETADASSFVLAVPDDLSAAFAYEAGQFCTFRVVIDGDEHFRCYSMSSSPVVDDELQVTVKRVPGGLVSNWMNDVLHPGDTVETGVPAGVFHLGEGDGDIVMFGAGSGVTPIFAILKTALATTSRRVFLLYANRDRDAVIFAPELDALQARHPDRLTVHHHLDVEHGFVVPDVVRPLARRAAGTEYLICGPGPFMDVVEWTLLEHDVDAGRIRIERFTAPFTPPEPVAGEPASATVTIELHGRVATAAHRPGTTILQVARELGLSPPFSCEAGSCATCMARLIEGEASMRTNDALTPEEVADGWVLTCQAVPASPSVRVVYE